MPRKKRSLAKAVSPTSQPNATAPTVSKESEDPASIQYYRGRVKERYRTEFGAFAERLCKDRSLADKAMENAFTVAFRSLSSCGGPEDFRNWFKGILFEQCKLVAQQ